MLRDNSRTYYECYRAEECYFNKEILLYGTGRCGQRYEDKTKLFCVLCNLLISSFVTFLH